MEKQNPAPQFGDWKEDVLYTAYFEKARPTKKGSSSNNPAIPPPNPNQMNIDSLPPATRDPNADLRRKAIPSRPSSSASQRSTIADLPQVPTKSQHQPTVRWAERTREETDARRIPQNNIHSSSRQGWERGVEVAAPQRNHPYDAYGSAPATPQRTPVHKAAVPKFGDWNVNSSGSDGQFTQVFGALRQKKERDKQPMCAPVPETSKPTSIPQKQPMFKPEIPRPMQKPRQQPMFMPEVERPRPRPSPSPPHDYQLAAKDKGGSKRCWPFRFSFK